MNVLWTSEEVAQATGGKMRGADCQISGVSINTRTIEKGDLFVALKGDNSDGHKWVSDAFAKGASAALVEYIPEDVEQNAPLVVMEDSFKALEALGKAARTRTAAKIIGVTGSVGKTTTKEMLTLAFQAGHPVPMAGGAKIHSSAGGYNNHWGVPVSLARMPKDTEIGIFEMGMNHAEEMAALTAQVKPDLALITTVAAVHEEHFPDGEAGIAAAKAEIFEGMRAGGIAVLNRDNRWFDLLAEKASARGLQVFSFGEHEEADAKLLSVSDGKISALIKGQNINFLLKLAGKHMALNALGALLCVAALGGDVERAAPALAEMMALGGRGQRSVAGGVTIIDESYNASPVAVRAALKVLQAEQVVGRKIFVLGEMYELGDNAVVVHENLQADIVAAGVDKVFTSGALVEKLFRALPESLQGAHDNDSVALSQIVKQAVKPGDTVLIKGSRGGGEKPRMQYVVDALKGP